MSWFWKADDGWKAYSAEDNNKLEDGFRKKQKKMKLNDTYSIDYKEMIQHRSDDYNRQREIKREALADEGKGFSSLNLTYLTLIGKKVFLFHLWLDSHGQAGEGRSF
jgi:hypothetical protein